MVFHPNPSYKLLNVQEGKDFVNKSASLSPDCTCFTLMSPFFLEFVSVEELWIYVFHPVAFDVASSELCYAGGIVFIQCDRL